MPNTLLFSSFDCPFSAFETMVKKADKEQGYLFLFRAGDRQSK